MRSALAIFALATLTACGKSPSRSVRQSSSDAKLTSAQHSGTTLAPETVLVTVNGQTFTVQQCDEEVKLRLDPVKKQLPPKRIPEVTQKLKARLIREFVFETLLIEEARRQGITVTKEDEQLALDRIDKQLRPKGTTVEEVLAESPAGETRLRNEVLTGIYVERLIATYLTNDLSVTDEAIAQYSEANRASLAIPERVHARHILIKTADEDTPEIKEEKLKRLRRIRQDILAGADFAAAARKYSDCPSGERGGDLGRFTRGRMVKPFEAATFSQKTNEVGNIIETDFGYHIVQVLEHTPAGLMSKDEIAAMLKAQNRSTAMKQLMKELVSKADITPPALADKLLLP